MSQFTIFANGELSTTNIALPPDATIIAADGGAKHCLALGIIPHVVIGDFDSLSEKNIAALDAAGTEFIRHPTSKDETDLELALDYSLGLGASEVTLYSLLGGRWDMTFANILLLASARYTGIRFRILDGNSEALILRGGETLNIEGQPGNIVSVIPLDGPASGICYTGLRWPLNNATLPFGSPKGVSNVFLATKASISLDEGLLLVFVSDPMD